MQVALLVNEKDELSVILEPRSLSFEEWDALAASMDCDLLKVEADGKIIWTSLQHSTNAQSGGSCSSHTTRS